MPSPNIDPTVRLFIGGLPYRFTEGELLTLFAPFGRIVSLKIMHTAWGKSRGMGFLEFDNLDSAIRAKQSLHNHRVSAERTIIVDYAAPDPVEHPELRIKKEPVAPKPFVARDPFTKQNRGTNKSVPVKPGVRAPFKKKFGSSRQSVFDSRSHHSSVGAKFAKRKSR